MDLGKLKRKIEENDCETVKDMIGRVEDKFELHECLQLSLTLQRNEIFELILQLSHSVLNLANDGETILHLSLKCSDEYFMLKLLKTGGIKLDLEIYKTILHAAVKTDETNMVEPLLKYGAFWSSDDTDVSPLDIAIENNNFEMVSMFLYYDYGTKSQPDHITPFMYSMLCNSSREIQLLLLEYEVDMNNKFLARNNLFVAIKRCKYLVREILERGADVNQVCNGSNIIEFILEHPIDSDIFAIIWQRFDYEIWESDKRWSVLMRILSESCLPDQLWLDYLRIVFESSKLIHLLNAKCPRLISVLVEECVKRKFNENDYYDLACILLVNSCPVFATDLHKVYTLLGSKSIVLKLLIHINIETTNVKFIDINFIKIRYSCDNTVDQMLRNFATNMRIFNMTASYKDILRYFTVPPKVKEYLRNPIPSKLAYLTWDPVVPSLLELARNRSRDVICDKYNVKNGGMYYSIVNHMVLPRVIKDTLTFEKPLYFEA